MLQQNQKSMSGKVENFSTAADLSEWEGKVLEMQQHGTNVKCTGCVIGFI